MKFFKVRLCVSDGNMEDQELNEQQNKEAFLKGENLIMYRRMILNSFLMKGGHLNNEFSVVFVLWV